jgi:cbb3-type cytochrome oxidase subunit 3
MRNIWATVIGIAAIVGVISLILILVGVIG